MLEIMAVSHVQWETEHLDHKSVCATSAGLVVVSRHCPERPYVELRVPEKFKSIIAIIFTISSHDQGEYL